MSLQQELVDYFTNDVDACETMLQWYVPDTIPVVDMLSEPPKKVASYGGEDQGSTFWKVWRFTRGNETVLIKFDANYQSHYGTTYLGFSVVEPYEEVVINYRSVVTVENGEGY